MRVPLTAAVVAAALLFQTEAQADSSLEQLFQSARAAVLVRVLESTYPSPPSKRDSESFSRLWDATAKLLVLRSWKGPFLAGSTISASGKDPCFGPCVPYQFQVGQEVVVFLYEEGEPVHAFAQFPNSVIDGDHGIRVEDAVRMLDAAAKTGT
jgi:hypothetical protein